MPKKDDLSPPYREDVPDLVAAHSEIDMLRKRVSDQQRTINAQSQHMAMAESELYAARCKLEESERLRAIAMADLKAMETATLRYYAFASDDQIKAYADQQPNEQAKKIADLTLRLRREMAGKMEIQAALGVMIQRMKTKVPAMSEEDFGKRFG